MLGRDIRTLNKLFDEVVYSPVESDQLLVKLREAMDTKQEKIIEGLRY